MRRVFMVGLCGLLALMLAAAIHAQKLPEIKFEKYTLPNGLQVVLHEDHTVPMVSINLWYHVGSRNEKPGKTGFAHLFEHMMYQGSEHVPYGVYDSKTEGAGGDNNGSTTQDRTNYWINLPTNYLELGLWLESDRMGNLLPAVTQERIDNQRDVVKNERRQRYENQPYGRIDEIARQLMYPVGHPYSWSTIGSMADLSAASLEDVKDFFRQYYTPNNASLCIAGDINPAAVKQLVERYFGPIAPGPNIERITNMVPQLQGVQRLTVEDNIELPRVYMYWHSPAVYSPGDAELDLLSTALVSGKSSRLYKALVYDQQIAQDVSAYQYSQEIAGRFAIVATAREGHTLAELERAIDIELQKIMATGITATELKNAQTSYEVQFVQSLAPVGGFGGRADKLNEYNTRLGDPGKFQWDLDRYTTATAAGVLQAAKTYLDMNRRAIIEVIPRGDRVAAKSDVDMTKEPASASEPTFKAPKIQIAKLSNGMELRLVEDHRLPLIGAGLIIGSGWSADPSGKPGTASLTSALLNEGTKTRTSIQISDLCDQLGIALGGNSDYDATNVVLNTLKRNFDPALDLMADIVMNPTFPQEELDRNKADYLGRITQESVQPGAIASRAFAKVLYGEGHPYAQPPSGLGTASSVKAITRADLEAFHKATYLPNNAVFVMAGDITMAEAQAKLEKAFKNWKPGTVAAQVVPTPKAPEKTTIYLVDKPGAAQSMVFVGQLGAEANSPDRYAAILFNNALGGGASGRLYMNLREKKGYTYGAYSNFTWRKGLGPFLATASVQTKVTKDAVSEFVKEFTELGTTRPLTAEEIAWNKDNLTKKYPQAFETMGDIVQRMYAMTVQNLPTDYWQTYQDKIRTTDAAAIQGAVQKYVHPNGLVIVVVGDRATIEPGLKELNIGDVVSIDPTTL